MVTVNIRTLMHNFAKYMKAVEQGERIVVLQRNKPVADIVPHNENIAHVGWKRDVKRIRLKKDISLAEEVVKSRGKESS